MLFWSELLLSEVEGVYLRGEHMGAHWAFRRYYQLSPDFRLQTKEGIYDWSKEMGDKKNWGSIEGSSKGLKWDE